MVTAKQKTCAFGQQKTILKIPVDINSNKNFDLKSKNNMS
jgi:hypothetical protein